MMNQAHEPLEDPREERLAEIERQLRTARPIPPQLDLAAIERLAREAPSSGDEPQVVLKPPAPSGRPMRSYAAVAGSWICGAIVGAAAMFFYEGRPASDAASSPATTIAADTTARPQRTPEDAIQPPRADLAAADNTGDWDLSWLASAEFRSPMGRGNLRSTWRVGMSLPNLAAASRHGAGTNDRRFDSTPNSPAFEPLPSIEHQDVESAPDVSRQRLLQELLGNAAGPIL
jgi:hypothetical protein